MEYRNAVGGYIPPSSTLHYSNTPSLPCRVLRFFFCVLQMMSVKSIATFLAFCAMALSTGAETGLPERPAFRTLTSHSRRFVVSSTNSADNLRWATWAENVTDKIAVWIGATPPFRIEFPFRISLYGDEEWNWGEIVPERDVLYGQLVQRLVLINPDLLNEELLLETMVELLLERYAYAYRDAPHRADAIPAVPAWMSVGLAQNLDPSWRARNVRIVLDRWLDNRSISMAEVFELEELPPGVSFEKAASGLAVDWLNTHIRDPGLYRAMLREVAAGGSPSQEWLVSVLPGYDSAREMEQDWDLWIARHMRVRSPTLGISARDLSELRALRTVRLDPRGDERSLHLPIRDLIYYWGEVWVPPMALRMAWQARSLSIGQAEDYRNVALMYAQFFDALQRSRPRWRPARAYQRKLEQLLKQADAALAGLEQSLAEEAWPIDD